MCPGGDSQRHPWVRSSAIPSSPGQWLWLLHVSICTQAVHLFAIIFAVRNVWFRVKGTCSYAPVFIFPCWTPPTKLLLDFIWSNTRLPSCKLPCKFSLWSSRARCFTSKQASSADCVPGTIWDAPHAGPFNSPPMNQVLVFIININIIIIYLKLLYNTFWSCFPSPNFSKTPTSLPNQSIMLILSFFFFLHLPSSLFHFLHLSSSLFRSLFHSQNKENQNKKNSQNKTKWNKSPPTHTHTTSRVRFMLVSYSWAETPGGTPLEKINFPVTSSYQLQTASWWVWDSVSTSPSQC